MSEPPDRREPSGQPPDRLEALLGAAAEQGDELAELDAVIRRLRASDPVRDLSIDAEASWRRLESFLDTP
jgi:hypothetical protein